VGVRGETDELFNQGLSFIKSLDISQLHVFSYSERAGTKMLEIENVVSNVDRKHRSDELHTLSNVKFNTFYELQKGKTAQVLWESRQNGDKMVGFTNNYIRVEQPFDKMCVNTIHTITLGEWNEDKTALLSLVD